MTGTSSISLDLPGAPLLVRCDPVRLEQALVHLSVSALHHTLSGRMLAVRLTGGAPSPDARVELSAPAMQLPAAELARLISRFAAAVGVGGGRPGPASLRMLRGGVQATSGAVTASSSPDGLVFRARWDLAQDPAALIDLR
jgi:signal transduction histidine kinase